LDGPGDYSGSVNPPVELLAVAVAAVALSALAILVGSSEWISLAGWAFGSLVTVAAVSRFRSVDNRRSAWANYAPRPVLRHMQLAILAIGIALAAVNAWDFATEIAKRTAV
jgi:hypothetical protein